MAFRRLKLILSRCPGGCRLLLLSLLVASGRPALAQSSASPLSAGYLHQFETDIDGGGTVARDSFDIRGAIPFIREEGRVVALSGGYGLNAYHFSGGGLSSFSALDPWDDIHSFRLGLPIRWDLGGEWSFFGLPTIRSVGESGASFADTISGGALVGASYRFGDKLELGPGLGYISQIEDDASIFPIILVNWKMTDDLSLTTGPALGATLGPGLSLNWDVSQRWSLSFGARYEKHRFRLDDRSAASPGGVGEDRGVPVFTALSYTAGDHWQLSLIGGVDFGSELTLEDGDGKSLIERDYDPAPFVGVYARFRF